MRSEPTGSTYTTIFCGDPELGARHPESAAVVEAEQLELPVHGRERPGPRRPDGGRGDTRRSSGSGPAGESLQQRAVRKIELSFSQLHDFDVCPVRYRFSQVWGVPAPPDERSRATFQAIGSTELGPRDEALAAWHNTGGELLEPIVGRTLARDADALPRHPLRARQDARGRSRVQHGIGARGCAGWWTEFARSTAGLRSSTLRPTPPSTRAHGGLLTPAAVYGSPRAEVCCLEGRPQADPIRPAARSATHDDRS